LTPLEVWPCEDAAVVQRLARLEIQEPTRLAGFSDAVQRAADLLLVTLTAPLWGSLFATLIGAKLLCDGRPVLFRHRRLGRGGQPFDLLKIRTTIPSYVARPEDWPDDRYPPRTRFGRLLRRVDLDELPQLWNVLAGDMSLVGPRPETDYHAFFFATALPDYVRRLAVRPGLTGLAQVEGWRGDTSIEERLRCDLEYIERRGPVLYFATLARTFTMELRRLMRPAAGH